MNVQSKNREIMKQATANLFFDTTRDDNRIRLNVIFERKLKLFSTGLKASKVEWGAVKEKC